MKVATTIRPLTYDDYFVGLKEYIDLVSESSYDAINFNFKFLYKITENSSKLKKLTTSIKKMCDEKGIDVPITHGYYLSSFILNNKKDQRYLFKKVKECIELSKIMGAHTMVVHAGIYFDNDGYNERKTAIAGADFFEKICKIAIEKGVKIAIENNVVYNGSYDGAIVEPNAIVINRICDIINEKLDAKVAGVCYDVGHANLAKRDIVKDIEKVKGNLFTLHLHNNKGFNRGIPNVWESDLHNMLSEGNIDINEILKCLLDMKFDNDVVIETHYKGKKAEIMHDMEEDKKFFIQRKR